MLGKTFGLYFKVSTFVKKMAQNVVASTELAQRVQHNVLAQNYSIEHQSKLRQRVTLENTIEGLEKELRKEIAYALKKSESKVIYYFDKANEMFNENKRRNLNGEQIRKYNKLRQECEKARWEYIVHRNACGFTIKNYELITSMFKIPPPI